MMRQLSMIFMAAGALAFPACSEMQPYQVSLKNQPTNPQVGMRSLPGVVNPNNQAAPIPSGEQFADQRPLSQTVTPRPIALADQQHTDTNVQPIKHEVSEKTDELGKTFVSSQANSSAANLEFPKTVIETKPDADGVTRPAWPTFKNNSTTIPENSGNLKIEQMQLGQPAADLKLPTMGVSVGPTLSPIESLTTKPDSTQVKDIAGPSLSPNPKSIVPPMELTHVEKSVASTLPEIQPAPIPKSVLIPLNHQTNSAPAEMDPPLVQAIKAFVRNKPEEGIQHLNSFDTATQQLLASLIPVQVRFAQSGLKNIKSVEADSLLEHLSRAAAILRPLATLQANNVAICREVYNFAHISPFKENHEFRPGDMVYLYMELANFTCEPDAKDGFNISFASNLELHDVNDKIVWQATPEDSPDHLLAPPQDYYRNFRMFIPNVPPGKYALHVRVADRPTNREVKKTIEMKIGMK